MTTKPKASKFRIRRSASQAAPAAASAVRPAAPSNPPPAGAQSASGGQAGAPPLNAMEQLAAEGHEDGFGDRKFTTTGKTGNVDSAAEVSAEDDIAAIRKEGLTGRQLRMARRVAQKHGIAATSDFDAVRQLRKAGIDPFQRAAMLELVSAEGQKTGTEQPKLPQTVDKPQLPSRDVLDAASRAQSVLEIQRDIARRRRRKSMLLLVRLLFFVLVPTLIAGYYYYAIATPMYATKSEFVIQTAESSSGLGSSLLRGTGLGSSQDSITVQSYLTSRDAMLRLDEDEGFKAHFQNPDIDPIQRLAADASNEAAYKLYKRNVKIGYDPSEGIIKMEVIATDPKTSRLYSEALIRYAEDRVDHLTARKRADAMRGAQESYDEAEQKMLEAQAEVERLQAELGVFDGTGEATAKMQQISTFETQLLDKQLQLQQLLDNSRPNQARVDGVRGDIARLEDVIAQLRGELTEGSSGSASLAEVSGKLALARTNLETRIVLMQTALQQRDSARIEANKQTRYLELGVRPVAPDEPTFPRAFEDTLLAFLVFAGIYLMLSLTVSILREQVSS